MRQGFDLASNIPLLYCGLLSCTTLVLRSISERFFTCSWASEASLSLLLAHKYGQEVLDLNDNVRPLRESCSSVVMWKPPMWDLFCKCESYTLALCDATLRMVPRPFTRLFEPSKSESYLFPAVLSTFKTEVIFSSASFAFFCRRIDEEPEYKPFNFISFSSGRDPYLIPKHCMVIKLPALRR